MHLVTSLAIEWFLAAGPRNEIRLLQLVNHFRTTNGITDYETVTAIEAEALGEMRRRGILRQPA